MAGLNFVLSYFKRLLLQVASLFFCVIGHAQTGPAGVGTTTTNVLWLKADVGPSPATSGSLITSWTDQSGNANTVSQATTAKQPVFQISVINGLPAVQFDNVTGANNDELVGIDNDDLDNTGGLTILTVSRPQNLDGATARAIISKRVDVGNNESFLMFYYTSNFMDVDLNGNGDRFASATAFANNTNYIIDLLYDGSLAAAQRSKLYINENLDVTKTASSTTIPNFTSSFTVGSLNVGDGRPFGGYIAEVIIYRNALNVAERFIADNYLSSKYNITLAANDLYAGDTGPNGDFDFEVAGVGTDASGSNASASSSISGGLSVTQQSGFQNADYLLYGHSSAVNNTNTSDVAGMTGTQNARWNRIWYVDVTNAGANEVVNLTFDMSDAGTPVTPTIASNYVLLFRATQVGAWTEMGTASSISGDQISFPSVTFSLDGYYTLGTHNKTASPLPVKLVSFTGVQTDDGIQLSWTTASELNNDFFTVERSYDGIQFVPEHIVKSNGTTSIAHTYTLLDPKPSPGQIYYRLKQTDLDGVNELLGVIMLAIGEIPRTLNLYPNPAKEHVHLQISGVSEISSLTLYDRQGKEIPISYSPEDGGLLIDTRSLQKGIYILKLDEQGKVTVRKLIIE